MEVSVARVYLLDAPYHIDRLYDYYIPEDLRGLILPGTFAAVPFGGGNKKQLALVFELASSSEFASLKPIISPVCGSIRMGSEMLGLCLYMKEHCLCSVGDAVKSMIPSAALTKVKNTYSALPVSNDLSLTPKQRAIYELIAKIGPVAEEILADKEGPSVLTLLSRLTAMGALKRDARFVDSRVVYTETAELEDEYLTYAPDEIVSLVRGESQRRILRALATYGKMNVNDLKDELEVSGTQIKNLAGKGIVKLKKDVFYRDPYSGKKQHKPDAVILSPEQERAKGEIMALCRTGEPKAVLLHGVTGSGKTNVIKSVMDEVIASGKSVIMLVPEIALTPQTVGIFRAYYGERTAVIHSGLSKGERFDAWRKISDGEADICIGTRSAIFAPFKNLGLIVLDEEQEHTYKSDMDPKYHARDIARYRCAKQNAVMLLASATPSAESYSKALEGKYSLVTLKERYGNATLPETVITDMRKDSRGGSMSPIGTELSAHISAVLERGEQAILFINQRGYNRFLSCPLCGNVLMCGNCSVSYTYHTLKSYDRGYLYCHYCGSRAEVPKKCPQCGNETLKHMGYGTQMVESELKRLFPQATVMRMDADTTREKFAYDDLLDKFRSGAADILIGTQMVTKGHDFPAVTLVGVINADSSLYLNDYKANERTFDLITQVIGRAGRGEKKGCALIQTYNPDHPTLLMSAEQDYEKMFKGEIAMRRSLMFPPYCDMVQFSMASESETELLSACDTFKKLYDKAHETKYADVPSVFFGPMEAPIYKINGVYRMISVIKCKMTAKTRALMAEVYAEISRTLGRKISISVDINPS